MSKTFSGPYLDVAVAMAPGVAANVADAMTKMTYPDPDWRRVWFAALTQNFRGLGGALDGGDDTQIAAQICQLCAVALAYTNELDRRLGRINKLYG